MFSLSFFTLLSVTQKKNVCSSTDFNAFSSLYMSLTDVLLPPVGHISD